MFITLQGNNLLQAPNPNAWCKGFLKARKLDTCILENMWVLLTKENVEALKKFKHLIIVFPLEAWLRKQMFLHY